MSCFRVSDPAAVRDRALPTVGVGLGEKTSSNGGDIIQGGGGDQQVDGGGRSYLPAEAAAMLACVTATLLVLPLLLPPTSTSTAADAPPPSARSHLRRPGLARAPAIRSRGRYGGLLVLLTTKVQCLTIVGVYFITEVRPIQLKLGSDWHNRY